MFLLQALAVLLVLALTYVVGMALAIYYGWVLSILWNWFAVPMGAHTLGVVNAIVRPIAVVLTLPLTLLSLGLFLLVINAAMLGLVALLLGGFAISGFWTAIGASLLVSVTSWLASGVIANSGRVEVITMKK